VTCSGRWSPPSWSPDGSEIVAAREYDQGLWRIMVPEPGEACEAPVRVTSGPYGDQAPQWARLFIR
jgi:Tol biopolymer transport system component